MEFENKTVYDLNGYYSILGIDQYSSQDEIKKRFRELSIKLHPNKGGDKILYQKIVEAYDILKDSESRQKYDDKSPMIKEVENISPNLARHLMGLLGIGVVGGYIAGIASVVGFYTFTRFIRLFIK